MDHGCVAPGSGEAPPENSRGWGGALKTYEGNNQVHYVHSSHNVLHIVPYEAGYVAPMIYTYEHRI